MGETDGRFCLLSHGLYVEWKYDAEWFKSHVCAIVHIPGFLNKVTTVNNKSLSLSAIGVHHRVQ